MRTQFLSGYLLSAKMRAYVLGISGGVDSLLAGLLAQRAVRRVRDLGHEAQFIAVRMPYGVQADEADAGKAIATIDPDRTLTVRIKSATDAIFFNLQHERVDFRDHAHEDLVRGNIKARQRMVAQYAVAGAVRGLVVGTDHAAEAVMGFFTKFGDGAADILPLAGLVKRRIRAMAQTLGAPDDLVFKVPTADLESRAPLRPDEDSHGVTYDQIDDFLEGKTIPDEARTVILALITVRRTRGLCP
jgi:NAD+ synthase